VAAAGVVVAVAEVGEVLAVVVVVLAVVVVQVVLVLEVLVLVLEVLVAVVAVVVVVVVVVKPGRPQGSSALLVACCLPARCPPCRLRTPRHPLRVPQGRGVQLALGRHRGRRWEGTEAWPRRRPLSIQAQAHCLGTAAGPGPACPLDRGRRRCGARPWCLQPQGRGPWRWQPCHPRPAPRGACGVFRAV
jgi:hypothetical protein